MSHVEQVTQRNASAAEELASTAEQLSGQAQALQQLISFFNLERTEKSYPLQVASSLKASRMQASSLHSPQSFVAPGNVAATTCEKPNGYWNDGGANIVAIQNEQDFQRF